MPQIPIVYYIMINITKFKYMSNQNKTKNNTKYCLSQKKYYIKLCNYGTNKIFSNMYHRCVLIVSYL